MARPIHKLSALKIANLTKPGRYCDGNGLWLQVAPGGTKSWVFRYHVDGKRHEVGLGSTALVSLADARAAAQAHRQQVHGGHDPLLERQRLAAERRVEAAKQITFNQCAAKYIAAHRAGWRNEKHAKQWEATLQTYAAPVIGDLPVAAIDTQLVLDVLEPIWTSRTETATRIRGRIESVLDWAKVKGFREGDNPARWRGHLDQLLAAPRKVAKVENHPALPWQEAPGFIKQLRNMLGISPQALEFLILTAARSAEVRLTTWNEIDEKSATWSIPADRMKAGRPHRVPLSKRALALLEVQPSRSGFVFSMNGKVPLSDMTLTAVLRRMGRADISVHGFRSTFRDWCAEYAANSFSREVCEYALAHRVEDRVEAAYRRGDLLEKRRGLMEAWAKYLDGAKD
jgi:integrase